MPEPLTVGSIVRVTTRVSSHQTHELKCGHQDDSNQIIVARRATVAMLPGDAFEERSDSGKEVVSLIQDDYAPHPLNIPNRPHGFVIAPLFDSKDVSLEECDAAFKNLSTLLPFELISPGPVQGPREAEQDAYTMSKMYKGYGDELLRLHDYTWATSYYEAALSFISPRAGVIGGTIMVLRSGCCVVAEIDCVNDDDIYNPTYDVTYISPGGQPTEEDTLTQEDILLTLWPGDNNSECLQPRILLNLSRCLMRLADADNTLSQTRCIGSNAKFLMRNNRKGNYREAAALGSSLAITLFEYYVNIGSSSSAKDQISLLEKSRIVRARAFLGLENLPKASNDLTYVLSQNPSHCEARRLLRDVKAMEKYKKSIDKRLTKDFCRWIETATSTSNGREANVSVSGAENVELGVSQSEDSPVLQNSGVGLWSWLRQLWR